MTQTEVHRIPTPDGRTYELVRDWTMAPGTWTSNSSPEMADLIAKVEHVIRGAADDLIKGDTERVAIVVLNRISHAGHKPAGGWTADFPTEVACLIRDSAHALISGRAHTVAGLIVAQLAHKHGLAPAGGVAPRSGFVQ